MNSTGNSKKNEILREMGLINYKNKIEFFDEDGFEQLEKFLTRHGYSLNCLGRIERAPEEWGKGLCDIYEEWLIIDLISSSEAIKIIVQDQKLISQCIYLLRLDEYVIISSDEYIYHELYHVKDSLHHPELKLYKKRFLDGLDSTIENRQIIADAVLDTILDYTIDTRLKNEKQLDYKKRYEQKMNKMLELRWNFPLAMSFEIFILSEGKIPEKIANNPSIFWPLELLYQDEKLQEFLRTIRGNFLFDPLLEDLICMINRLRENLRK
ncbi:MAG: hypothetical protein ACTSRW_06430 [Candidatus Helarchaeota archaeon]